METRIINDTWSLENVLPAERTRLVGLCTYLTGDADAAEDLAQETLIEAWRHQHKLVHVQGYRRWLSAIARNVCLRWLRQHGREATMHEDVALLEDTLPDTLDLEVELERDELAHLLDRALALLPPDTRLALIERYIHESPQAEIAARLGVSEGAVEAKLHRGKLTMRRVLTTEMREEARAYGLVDSDGGWQETRIWCPGCGQHHLMRNSSQTMENFFEVRCPACDKEPHTFFAQSPWLPSFNDVKGTKPLWTRFANWMHNYLVAGVSTGSVACRICGHITPLHLHLPAYAPASIRGGHGVHVKCEHCNASSYCTLYGLTLDLPGSQRFWQHNPRMYELPIREMDYHGREALLLSFASVSDANRLDIIVERDTYKMLGIYGGRDE